jgi:dienelactone hydrolase
VSASLREELRQWLRLPPPPAAVEVAVAEVAAGPSFERRRITYPGREGDPITAFLLIPRSLRAPAPAVLVHHQHAGERHLGKSEVCGLAGDPLQAFGVALAEQGFIVLAPDSICFEDRRTGCTGIEPHPDDWQQHYDQMTYRLVRGDTLMRKVLDDAETALSVLAAVDGADPRRIGLLGHSYGGNTVLFQSALDERVQYACASGAACSYRAKLQHRIGIEMAEVLPGVVGRLDIDDLLRLTAPRPMLIVSSTEDPYSRDAEDLVLLATPAYAAAGAPAALQHTRYPGGHALTRQRFDEIVNWFATTRGAPH